MANSGISPTSDSFMGKPTELYLWFGFCWVVQTFGPCFCSDWSIGCRISWLYFLVPCLQFVVVRTECGNRSRNHSCHFWYCWRVHRITVSICKKASRVAKKHHGCITFRKTVCCVENTRGGAGAKVNPVSAGPAVHDGRRRHAATEGGGVRIEHVGGGDALLLLLEMHGGGAPRNAAASARHAVAELAPALRALSTVTCRLGWNVTTIS